MKKTIQILDNITINKIAAGEVVQGSFSVVKELIENAIDAEATFITLEAKEGGKSYIRVSDNGIGISENDIEKAFLRHSTSKITSIQDLSTINSLGFRGEALASIASISEIEIITKTQEQQYGISMQLTAGKVISKKQIGCPQGTTIIVKNIFFNTPVRYKFLKSNQVETGKISDIITRLSIGNPCISFKYINNNNIMFATMGDCSLSNSILILFGKEIYKNIIKVHEEKDGISIMGYIGQPTIYRGNRSFEMFFINGRYVKNKPLNKVVESAYKEKLMVNRYPFCVLNINIDPSTVDVNVHPAKTEIKFHDEQSIQKFVFDIIDKALKKYTSLSHLKISETHYSSFDDKKDEENNDDKKKYIQIQQESINHLNSVDKKVSLAEKEDFNYIFKEQDSKILNKESNKDLNTYKLENAPENLYQGQFYSNNIIDYKIIGQIFNTYIIVEKDKKAYIIDQHAAHERLIYNKLLNELENESVVTQPLLTPYILNISSEEQNILMQKKDMLYKIGFSIESFGYNAIIIRAVPLILGNPQTFEFLLDFINELEQETIQKKIIQRACKEAIKANQPLKKDEIDILMKQLDSKEYPLTCPHGRPIVLVLTKKEMEKHFNRI